MIWYDWYYTNKIKIKYNVIHKIRSALYINVMQCSHRRTVLCTKIWWSSAIWFSSYVECTDWFLSHLLTYLLCTLLGQSNNLSKMELRWEDTAAADSDDSVHHGCGMNKGQRYWSHWHYWLKQPYRFGTLICWRYILLVSQSGGIILKICIIWWDWIYEVFG